MIRDFSLWGRVCRDTDGAGGGGGLGGAAGSYSGKGGLDSPGEGAGLGGKSSTGGGGRAGAVGQEGVGGGFSSSGKSTSAPAAAAPSSNASGRAGGVGHSGVSGGFSQAAGLSRGQAAMAGMTGMEFGTNPGKAMADATGVPAQSVQSVSFSPTGGTTGGRAGAVGKEGVGGGFAAAAGAPSYSGKVGSGLDAPSEAGPGPGGKVGGYTGRGSYDTPSETSGVGRGVSGRGFYGGTSIAEGYAQAAAPALAVGIGSVSGRIGMTDAFLDPVVDAIVGAESGGRATAKNPKSTANGVGQFLDATWSATIAKHRPDLAEAHTRQEIMAMKTDPVLGRAMTKAYVQDNAQHLAKNNVTVNPTTLYAAHFLGPVGATKAAKADPTTPAVDVLGAKVVAANSSVMSGKTIGQVMGYIESKMANVTEAIGTGRPGAAAASRSAPSVSLPDEAPEPTSRVVGMMPDEAPTPTSRMSNFADPPDEGRFAAKYLSIDPQVGVKAAHEQFAESIGKTNVMGLDGKTAPYGTMTGVHTAPPGQVAVQSGSFNESQRGAAAASDVGSRAGRVADSLAPQPSRELSAIRSGWSDGPEPLSDVTSPELSAMNPQTAAAEEDSLGETLTGTGIDIGLGALPGIGIGVTAINAGLAIAGRDTIGQTIADALFSGNSKGLVGASGNPTGDGGWALDLEKTDSVNTEVDNSRPAETGDFAWKYLSKRDETKRPTPREKYYTNRETYGANYA